MPYPSPGNLPHQGIEPVSLMSPILVDGFFTTRATWEAQDTLRKFKLHNFAGEKCGSWLKRVSRSLQDHKICYLQRMLGYVVLTTQIACLNISGQNVCTMGVVHTHGLSRPGVSCCPRRVTSRASALEASLFLSSTLHGLKFHQERTQDTLS